MRQLLALTLLACLLTATPYASWIDAVSLERRTHDERSVYVDGEPYASWIDAVSLERRTHDERSVYVDGEPYLVVFGILADGGASIPLTNPPGQPHYGARITVYHMALGGRQPVGEPFDGQWTPNGCFEDDPETLVRLALKRK